MKNILEACKKIDVLEIGTSEIFTHQIFHHWAGPPILHYVQRSTPSSACEKYWYHFREINFTCWTCSHGTGSWYLLQINTGALRTISVAVPGNGLKFLSNGVKLFNGWILKTIRVYIELINCLEPLKTKMMLPKSSTTQSILSPVRKWLNHVIPKSII